MASARTPNFEMVAGAVRAELARRNILRRDAVAALMEHADGLGRTAAYERLSGTVPLSLTELEILSASFSIPLSVLTGTRAPDVSAVGR